MTRQKKKKPPVDLQIGVREATRKEARLLAAELGVELNEAVDLAVREARERLANEKEEGV